MKPRTLIIGEGPKGSRSPRHDNASDPGHSERVRGNGSDSN